MIRSDQCVFDEKPCATSLLQPIDRELSEIPPIDEDRRWIIHQMQHRRKNRTNLRDYLKRTHQMFLLQYTLHVKQEEIERLENQLKNEERALTKAEKHLSEDSALFDQFLDHCNRMANEAAQKADEEARKKEEFVNQIKLLQKTLLTCQNDRNYLVDTLKQSRRYQQFLFRFAPTDWQQQIQSRGPPENKTQSTRPSSTLVHISASDPELSLDSHEDYSIYFTKPEQLLDIFTEMEEKSLPLVEKSQQTSEILDRIRAKIDAIQTDQEQQMRELQKQIDQLEKSLEQAKERELAQHSILQRFQTEQNDPSIEQLKKIIGILYQKHVLSADMGISTAHMFEALEHRLKDLLNVLEQANPALVIEAEKLRNITVQNAEHQEKLQEEKYLNQLKHEKALLRAMAPAFVRRTRKIMERSRPLTEKKRKMVQAIGHEEEPWLRWLEEEAN